MRKDLLGWKLLLEDLCSAEGGLGWGDAGWGGGPGWGGGGVCAQTCAAHAVLAHNVRRTLNPAHPMLIAHWQSCPGVP